MRPRAGLRMTPKVPPFPRAPATGAGPGGRPHQRRPATSPETRDQPRPRSAARSAATTGVPAAAARSTKSATAPPLSSRSEMSPRADATASLRTDADKIVAELKRCVSAGETHWFLALMRAIRDWPVPEESIGDRTYRYLVGGEAFDWLLLRSEEHTSELQSPDHLVCRLLLEK